MPEPKLTIAKLCERTGWSISDLMREARLSYPTAAKAMKGDASLNTRIKRDICSALSQKLKENIEPGMIEW